MSTQRVHANSKQKGLRFKSRVFSLWGKSANHATIMLSHVQNLKWYNTYNTLCCITLLVVVGGWFQAAGSDTDCNSISTGLPWKLAVVHGQSILLTQPSGCLRDPREVTHPDHHILRKMMEDQGGWWHACCHSMGRLWDHLYLGGLLPVLCPIGLGRKQ